MIATLASVGFNIWLGISLAAPVGPVSIEIIRRGLRRGFGPAFTVACGAMVGDSMYLVTAYLGLVPLLTNFFIKISIWFFGAIVLLFLGGQCLRDAYQGKEFKGNEENEGKNAFFLGMALAVLNPRSIVWWMGIFGATLGEAPPESLNFANLLFNTTIILGVCLWSLFLSTVLHFGKDYVTPERIRWISALAGCSLVAFGLRFGYKAIYAVITA